MRRSQRTIKPVDRADVARALSPIAEEIQNRQPRIVRDDNWNPDFHVEITLRVCECREIIRLLERIKR